MKSMHNPKRGNNYLISRKKTQSTQAIALSLLGFMLFLTGGLVAATAVIDSIFNQVSVVTISFIAGGIVSYKLGRHIMERCAS